MLGIYRRHKKDCPHRPFGRDRQKCDCPVWCAGRVGNKPVRRSLDTISLERARRLALELEDAIRQNREPKPIAEAVDSFLTSRDVRRSTARRYGRAFRPLVDFMAAAGLRNLNEVAIEHLDAFRASRKVSGLTWSKELELLRSFFRFALKRRWCSDNPAAEMESPRNAKPRPRQPYTVEEVVNIFAAADSFGKTAYERLRARGMLMLMWRYGLRVSDVATLKRDRVKDGQIFLYAHKNGKPVWAPLYPEVREALERVPHPAGTGADCPCFFWSGKGDVYGHIKTVDRTMQAVFRKSGVERASAHRFRHTLAVNILVKGGTIEDAANILGDSPAVVRKHYLPWCAQFQSRITEALNRAHGVSFGTRGVHGDFPLPNPAKSTHGLVLEVGVENSDD